MLFKLARATIEVDRKEKLAAFKVWFDAVQERGLVGEGESRDSYIVRFMGAIRNAKSPLTAESPAERAWRLAETDQPPEASFFDGETGKRIVAACWHLERESKGEAWYLPCSTLARLSGLYPANAGLYLRAMIDEGILLVEEVHTAIRARRFRFIPQELEPPSIEPEAVPVVERPEPVKAGGQDEEELRG